MHVLIVLCYRTAYILVEGYAYKEMCRCTLITKEGIPQELLSKLESLQN